MNLLSTGSPEMPSKVFKEPQCQTRGQYLRVRLNGERQILMSAAAVLRRKGVDVDYADMTHLKWLEEVGQL